MSQVILTGRKRLVFVVYRASFRANHAQSSMCCLLSIQSLGTPDKQGLYVHPGCCIFVGSQGARRKM